MSEYSQVAQYDTDYSGNAVDGRSDSTSTDLEYDEEFEVLVNAFLKDMDYTSTRQAVFNIVYSIINSGLIALPFACYLAGIPTFITIVGGISLISGYVSIMVIAMANEQRVRTLEDLAQVAFGPNGFILVCAFQMLFSFTLMSITLDIFAEIMCDVFDETSVTFYTLVNRRGQVLIGSLLILPLCILKKSMSSLRWTSYFTVFVVAAALLGVVTVYVTDVDVSDHSSTKRVTSPKSAAWSALLIVIFCYSYNQKVFMIYSCLRRRTADRWGVAVKRANFVISVLYIVFGVFGYVSRDRIGEAMIHHDYFIDNKDENKIVFDVARVMVAFCLLLTIPVDCLVATTTCRRLVQRYRHSQFEKKLTRHLCCGGWFGSSKGSDNGSFNMHDEDGDQPNANRNHSEDLLLAHRPPAPGSFTKPRSASGSKKYNSKPPPVPVPAVMPPGIVKKGSVPTENVPIPNNDVSSGHHGLLGSMYRSLLFTPPSPTLTDINTTLNSRQNTEVIQEALSNSYDNSILKARITQSTQNDSSYGSSAAGQANSFNSVNSLNNEIMSSLHITAEDVMESGLRERGTGPMSPSKRSVSFLADGSHDSTRFALMSLEHPVEEEERRVSSGLNSEEGVKMNELLAAAASASHATDSTSLSSGNSGSSENGKARDRHSNENNYRAPVEGSTHTLDDLDRSFSTGGAEFGRKKTLCPTWHEGWPALLLWLLMTLLSWCVSEWILLATIATISTVILLFIFPTMFYFRLGLTSDYQAIAYCGVVPNRFFMMGVQFIGISILLYECAAFLFNLIEMGRVIHHKHN